MTATYFSRWYWKHGDVSRRLNVRIRIIGVRIIENPLYYTALFVAVLIILSLFSKFSLLVLIKSVGRDYQDCHKNKMASSLNVQTFSKAYISTFTRSLAQHTYRWSTNDGKGNWIPSVCLEQQQGIKPGKPHNYCHYKWHISSNVENLCMQEKECKQVVKSF